MSVAVTGRGVVTSLGEGADAFFESLAAGASGIVDGESRALHFDPERYMDPRVARRTDRFAQFSVAAAAQALEDGASVSACLALSSNVPSALENASGTDFAWAGLGHQQ